MNNVATGLANIGIGAGSVVCLWSSSYVEYWIVCLAVWELGGTVLPINCLTNTGVILDFTKLFLMLKHL